MIREAAAARMPPVQQQATRIYIYLYIRSVNMREPVDVCADPRQNDDGDAHDALPFHKLAGRRAALFSPLVRCSPGRRRSFYYRGAPSHKLSTRDDAHISSVGVPRWPITRLMCARLDPFVCSPRVQQRKAIKLINPLLRRPFQRRPHRVMQ